jgi:hypothetical protein
MRQKINTRICQAHIAAHPCAGPSAPLASVARAGESVAGKMQSANTLQVDAARERRNL